MYDIINKKIWLIGSGYMASEYCKVLDSLDEEFCIIGRGKKNLDKMNSDKNYDVVDGGIDNVISNTDYIPEYAINSVNIENLYEVTMSLLNHGVKKILVEKPGGLCFSELDNMNKTAEILGAEIYIAYNRRFYSSVKKCRDIIKKDGGVKSFNFEFTEWSCKLKDMNFSETKRNYWLLANSTHVIDLAFYLGGRPKMMNSYVAGKCDWCDLPSVYAGSGISENGALFSYSANWNAPGRWGVEILTNKHRLILRPLEKLKIQNLGSIQTEFVEIDDEIDTEFKAGLMMQTMNFLNNNASGFININDQLIEYKNYSHIMNGENDEK